LPLLSAAERQQLLVEWNATDIGDTSDYCLHELVEAQAARTPDAVALVGAGAQLSYSALNAGANQLAHYLRSLGVGPEICVGVCLERSLELVLALLAVLKAGGAYLPLEPVYPAARLRYMLGHTHASVLLTQERLVENVPEHQAQVFCLDAD